MPDFDTFERLFKSAMSSEVALEEIAKQIANLSEENKVVVVKNRSVSDLVGFLDRAKASLLGFFPSGTRFSSNDNNRNGKDLLEEISGIHVELKSGGAMTDANSGLSVVSWALDDGANKVKEIMKGGLVERRALVMKGSPQSAIEASKSRTMDNLAYFLTKQIAVGPAPDKLAHYLRCVAVGLTKGDEILAAYAQPGRIRTPLMLEADWNSGLVLYEKAFLPEEEITVTRIERTQDRAHLIAEGSRTKRTAKLYPNYKNSWKLANGKRIDASNWVKNACFHVWID